MSEPKKVQKTSEKPAARIQRAGSLVIDQQVRKVSLNGRSIPLPPCTFEYLITLLRNSPHPVSYQDLVSESQGYHLSRLEAQDLARCRIHLLRKALEPEPQNPQYILAVAGYGYRLSL